MIHVKLHPAFVQSYKKRIASNPKLVQRVKVRIELFQNNRSNPLLADHKQIGRLVGLRAFSVSGDIRIVYNLYKEEYAEFLDIGTHNQVY